MRKNLPLRNGVNSLVAESQSQAEMAGLFGIGGRTRLSRKVAVAKNEILEIDRGVCNGGGHSYARSLKTGERDFQ